VEGKVSITKRRLHSCMWGGREKGEVFSVPARKNP